MSLEHQIRNFARRALPQTLRRPLGIFAGSLRSRVLYPALGLIFDLTGGRFRADGCTFQIPRKITSLELRSSFLLGNYEEDERRLVRKFLLAEDRVLELGACLGILACITNKLLRDPSRHVVVEANPYCLPAIHRNRERNGASFLVEHCAVSSQREVVFNIHPTHVTGSSLHHRAGIAIRLPGRSLAELVARHGPFSVLILDIEGSEWELLQSVGDLLGKFRLILIELHEPVIGAAGVDGCRNLLQSAGFVRQAQSFISEVWLNPGFTHSPAA